MVSVLTLLGGLGLFLIGMQVLTDGLKSLAGEALRRMLVRFTRSPASGALTGTVATAILQSSSATTVAAVGFVGAGLLTFNQALGIIFGANIGTTVTGWIVALVGFQLDLTSLVFPLVFIGALLKLFARSWLQQLGWALAGFSLIFIGIDALQTGMAAYESLVTPTSFPGDTWFGRLQLVGIGILITIVTQSSSAGVATALVALSVGAISFSQAAAMVIGMDVGTTFTALLATLGQGTAMRRTGYAHVIYNLMTGIAAFLLLTPFTLIAGNWLMLDQASDAQIGLVAFHSTFNLLGVLVVIGLTRQFADLIERLVPERDGDRPELPDERLLSDGPAATNALIGHTIAVSQGLIARLHAALAGTDKRGLMTTPAIRESLAALAQYAARVRTDPRSPANYRLQSILHAQDHLVRLDRRLDGFPGVQRALRSDDLKDAVIALDERLQDILANGYTDDTVAALDETRDRFRDTRELLRHQAITRVASGEKEVGAALAEFDAMRWLHRCAYHAWRIAVHLENARSDTPDQMLVSEEHLLEIAENRAAENAREDA